MLDSSCEGVSFEGTCQYIIVIQLDSCYVSDAASLGYDHHSMQNRRAKASFYLIWLSTLFSHMKVVSGDSNYSAVPATAKKLKLNYPGPPAK